MKGQRIPEMRSIETERAETMRQDTLWVPRRRRDLGQRIRRHRYYSPNKTNLESWHDELHQFIAILDIGTQKMGPCQRSVGRCIKDTAPGTDAILSEREQHHARQYARGTKSG
jgi:hypothetical protein